MSWLSSVLQPGGTSAANTEQQNQAGLANDATGLLNQILPGLSQDYTYAESLEPQRQNDISNMLMQLSPGNTANQQQQYKNQAFANAGEANNQTMAQEQAGGLSPAYQAGNATAINNEAANQSNQYNAYTNSPEYQAQQGAAALNLYNQGETSPFSSDLSQLGGLIYGQPQVQVQQGIGGALGGILGDFLGGGGLGSALGGLFGGSSSGGSGQTSPSTGGAINYGTGSDAYNYGYGL